MMRQLPLGTHPESYRASYSYRGPRAMHRSNVSPLVDYCQDFGDGYCKVKTATGNGQQNGFLCWPTLLSDRREVMPPIPVIGVDGSGFAIVPIIYKAMIDNVLQNHSSLGVNLEGADPAVHFFYDSDGVWTPGSDTFQGLAVTGWGPFRAGDRRSTQDYDVQRRPAFERIGFPHSTHNILGSADYDHCSFADRVRFKGGEYRFSGCISEGDANLEADCIGGYHNANAAGGLRAHEMACRLLEPMNIDTVVPGPTDGQQFTGGPGNGPGKWDPIIPQLQYFAEFAVGTNGGEGGILIVGRDNGGPPSHLRVRFGWYVRNFGAGAGVKVLGGSTLWIEKYGILAVKANTPGSQIAIRLSGGSKARINAVDGASSATPISWPKLVLMVLVSAEPISWMRPNGTNRPWTAVRLRVLGARWRAVHIRRVMGPAFGIEPLNPTGRITTIRLEMKPRPSRLYSHRRFQTCPSAISSTLQSRWILRGFSRAGYGIPLILSPNVAWAERVRSYTSLSGVASDFGATTPEYLAAQSIFSQNPKPTKIMIGRLANKPTVAWKITVSSVLNLTAYSVQIGTQTATYTSDANATNDEIADGLAAAITALGDAGIVAATTGRVGPTWPPSPGLRLATGERFRWLMSPGFRWR
jgi:hypothetical protein